jgi:hypothetical protein
MSWLPTIWTFSEGTVRFGSCVWPRRTIRISKAGSTTTATSIGRSCARPSRGLMPMSSAGRAGSSSGCVTKPKERETGLSGFAVPIQVYSLIGSYVMAPAEHREPYESRGSRTCLGARGGEIPPRDSTKPAVITALASGLLCLSHPTLAAPVTTSRSCYE